MATFNATANSNISAYTLGSGDILVFNGFVITWDANFTAGTLTNNKGGTLSMSANNVVRTGAAVLLNGTNSTDFLQVGGHPSTVTLTSLGNIACQNGRFLNLTTSGVIFNLNCTAGTNTGGVVNSACVVTVTTAVTLTVNGTLTGGTASTNNANASSGLSFSGTGAIVAINGDILGGAGACGCFIQTTSTGTLTVNGNTTGGSVANCPGIIALTTSATRVSVSGSVTGGGATGSYGFDAESTSGSITLGTVVGNGYGGAVGTNSASTIINPVVGLNAIQSSAVAVYAVKQGPLGMSPTAGPYTMLSAPTGNTATHIIAGAGNTTVLVDPTASLTLSAADLRFGTVVGGVTGSLRVPAQQDVSYGALVDNTSGLAFINPSNYSGAGTANFNATIAGFNGTFSASTFVVTTGSITLANNGVSINLAKLFYGFKRFLGISG